LDKVIGRMNDKQAADELLEKHEHLKKLIGRVIIGQHDVLDQILLSVYSGGHCLLVGVPGLAKTLMVHTIARSLGLDFKRIQFTPDLMPSDIIGSEILDKERSFKFLKGPVFSNIILADEINRTPPKTQSALLEAMQEKSVTVAGERHELPRPYFVLATQNPIEQEGTYPLPEAQLDRFMFSIQLDYPSLQEEIEVVKSTTNDEEVTIEPLHSAQSLLDIQHLVRRVPVTDSVIEYAVTLVNRSRPAGNLATEFVRKYIEWGAGPRASQNLVLAAKAHALIRGKYVPDHEDIRAVAPGIMRHRVLKNYKAEAEGIDAQRIVQELF